MPSHDDISDQDKFHCLRCSSSFKRSEHLRRHLRGHEGSKRFPCSLCHKRFARSDILAKHRATHVEPRNGESLNSPGHDIRRQRACLECAKARERCTKGRPCSRCSTRSLACLYPDAAYTSGERQEYEHHENTVTQTHSLGGSLSMQEPGYSPTNDVAMATSLVPQFEDNRQRPQISDSSLATSDFIGTFRSQSRINGFAAQPQLQPLTNLGYGSAGFSEADLSINWLPANNDFEPDFDSIFGLIMAPDSFQNEQLVPADNTDIVLGLPAHSPLPSPSHLIAEPTPSHATSSPMSVNPISPVSPASSRGDLYATSSDGGRNPCTVRSKRFDPSNHLAESQQLPSIAEDDFLPWEESGPFGFPDLRSMTAQGGSTNIPAQVISTSTYETIRSNFVQCCLEPRYSQGCYTSTNFPSIEIFNTFASLYFQFLDPILPIIHPHSFNINNSWILALVIAGMGSQYSSAAQLAACAAPLHEFGNRVLQAKLIDGDGTPPDTEIVQAFVLSQIGLAYCGHKGFLKTSLKQRMILLQIVETSRQTEEGATGGLQMWERWIATETWRRLCHAVRLVDCMMSYHFNAPILPLDGNTTHLELPHDGLWNASTCQDWAAMYQRTERNPSLEQATSQLFQEKRIKSDLGEFSHLLLLHEIYREVGHVTAYHRRTLSSWMPSNQTGQPLTEDANHQPSDNTQSISTQAVPDTVSSWRNAALDCVDTLHWAANAKIAALAGAEHLMVLHLHFSRIVLLAPRRALMTLVSSVLPLHQSGQIRPHQQDAMVAERQILEWVQRDESKARLAAVHSGCFYWHIRRYSTMAFYEPISVFYATLALWAYGFYSPRGEEGSSRRSRSGSISDEQASTPNNASAPDKTTLYSCPDPTFIRLDRPNDDEMVQLFVRSGRPAAMKAFISGVGDICGPEGPARMLMEGRKMLGAVSRCWGRTREYFDMLLALEEATRGKNLNGQK